MTYYDSAKLVAGRILRLASRKITCTPTSTFVTSTCFQVLMVTEEAQ